MSDVVLRVEGLSKRYRLGQASPSTSLRDSLSGMFAAPGRLVRDVLRREARNHEDARALWALRDVSFEVRRGEVVGIIGRNGAGKSTLLKILSRITAPSAGRVALRGRVGALLEVGTGFHPELSGRENIMLNGAILGMRRAEILRKFDAIVAFAEVERFIDTPVKHYSSGMYMRLAFAVAAHLEPEILVVDEVLAVGDAQFQKKCLGKMGEVAREGRTVLFVSHQMAAVEALCTRGILLTQGRVEASGETRAVLDLYMRQVHAVQATPLRDRPDRQGDGRLRFTHVGLADADGLPVQSLVSGRDGAVVLGFAAAEPLRKLRFAIGISTMHGQFLLLCDNEMASTTFSVPAGAGSVRCLLPRLPLAPGLYLVNLFCSAGETILDWVQEAFWLEVAAGDFYGTGRMPPQDHGGFLAEQRWALAVAQLQWHST